MKKVIISVFILFFWGCLFEGETYKLTDDFEANYANSKKYLNISYHGEGIFDKRYCVVSSWNNSNYIIIGTLPRIDGNISSESDTSYFIIDVKKYRQNPNQMKSDGVFGPYNANLLNKKTDSLGLGKFELVIY